MKKGFTLIEMLAVIVLLGIIAVIAYPTVSNAVKSAKESALDKTIDSLENIAYSYSSENNLEQSVDEKALSFDVMLNAGFIKTLPTNPETGELLAGCVMYSWRDNQYKFRYDESCTTKAPAQVLMDITFTPLGTINSGWYKSNFYVKINVDGTSFKWCSGTDSCEPTTLVDGKTSLPYISTESSSNVICVKGYNYDDYSEITCSSIYKLDKTAPVISGVNNISVSKNTVIDLTSGVTATDSLSGLNGTYSYNPTSVNTSTIGSKSVTYSATDMAGNSTSVTKTITVLTDTPTISFSSSGTFNGNGWANSNFYITATATSDSVTSINSVMWCSGTSACTPSSNVVGNTASASITTSSANNVMCARAIDNTGHSSAVICSNAYKLDKVVPTLTAISSSVTIAVGDNNLVSTYFNTPTYGISGGSLACSPVNTSTLAVGTQSVSCTATGNNGLTTTASKTIAINTTSLFGADASGANNPELYTNMLPVAYNTTLSSWIYVSPVQASWYNYDSKNWANAVILNYGVTKNIGDIINVDTDVAQMYVWIPRYRYTIFNGVGNVGVSPQVINVNFETGTARTGSITCTDMISSGGAVSENCGTVTNNSSTYTHPAFTLGTTELKGIWVGKFENSNITACTPANYSIDTACDLITLGIQIKPNVISWRGARLSTFYTSISNISSTYGLTNADSHMMKNMEWGAVAYLKQSQYGLGITNIGINNNSSFKTGCGATAGSTQVSTCSVYDSTNGLKASTTGNIYGVYDISGGARELVMGNTATSSISQIVGLSATYSSGFEGIYYNGVVATGRAFPSMKYTNLYSYDASSSTTQSRGKLGDATKETLLTYGSSSDGWYSAQTVFPYNNDPLFTRGGDYSGGVYGGVFQFNVSNGCASKFYASRSVITSQ